MLDLELGDPRNAYVFFAFMTAIGVVLGGVIFAVVAFPWARRPRYRNFGAMPRTGIVCGAGTALFMACVAWNSAFCEFYRIEIDDAGIRFHYHMPGRTPELPRHAVKGMRRGTTMDKWNRWQILVETDRGAFASTNMDRRQFDAAWAALAPFVKPLA